MASSGVAWADLWVGSASEAFLGHFPAPLERLKNARKTAHNTSGICDLGSPLQGLPGAQKQHLEIADSSRELLKKVLQKIIQKSRLQNSPFIRFRETFVKFWPSGCSFLGLFRRQLFGKLCKKKTL